METAAALFQLDFKQDVFALLGVIYFAMLVYWISTIRETLAQQLTSGTEKGWIFFSLLGGLGFGAISVAEWGIEAAGTAFAIGLCISVALMSSNAAACLLASSLFLRPWELVQNDPYLGMLPRLSITLCLAHLFLHYAKNKKIEIEKNQVSGLLIAFTLWGFMTTLVAPDASASQAEFFDGFLKSIFLFFILIHIVRSRASLRMLIITLMMSFLFVGMISVYQTFRMSYLLPEADSRLRGFGAFKNSNDIAAIMVFIMPFGALAAKRKTENFWVRLVGVSVTLTAFVTIVLSRSRGALMGVAAMIAIHYIIKIGKKALVPVAAALLFLALPATIFISNRSSDDLEGSSAGRKTYLKAGIRMGFKNPIFGVGFNAFPESLQNYSTESLEESKQMTAHNSWVLVWAEMGPIGFALFTAIFIMSMLSAWKVYGTSPEFLLSIIGYGVAMFFLSHSYLIYPYLLYSLVQARKKLEGESPILMQGSIT